MQLGLYGAAWGRDGSADVDLIASSDPWAVEAFAATPTLDRDGDRVIGLPYLVLMKLDASRVIDQGELSRTLGRLDAGGVDEVLSVVVRYLGDPGIADDIRQYAAIGGWEYGRD